jgi:CelD/BcsL family acetyltransferase involved in cellulose biosynthesis
MLTTIALHHELQQNEAVFTAVSATQWNELVEASMTNTPFQRHAYQQAWWQHLGIGELYTVLVYRSANELIGIAPFYLHERTLFFNGSKEETDYLDIICRPADAEQVWQAVLDCLCQPSAPAWDKWQLHCIPSASPSREILPRLAASRGFIFAEALDEVCPVIPLEGDFEAYLNSINKKQRHEIRRKMRRAEEAGAELEQIGMGDDLPTAVSDFLALLQTSAPDKQAWLTPGRRALFHDLIPTFLAEGQLQLLFLRVDGVRHAALLNFLYHGRVWVYNSGINISHDHPYSPLSLGVVLSAHAIRLATERHDHAFDFLRGDEIYKYRFGATDTEIYCLQLLKKDEG